MSYYLYLFHPVTGEVLHLDSPHQIKARPEELAVSLRNYQSELSPDERLTLWETLRQGYCTDCARKLETGEKCHCENNE